MRGTFMIASRDGISLTLDYEPSGVRNLLYRNLLTPGQSNYSWLHTGVRIPAPVPLACGQGRLILKIVPAFMLPALKTTFTGQRLCTARCSHRVATLAAMNQGLFTFGGLERLAVAQDRDTRQAFQCEVPTTLVAFVGTTLWPSSHCPAVKGLRLTTFDLQCSCPLAETDSVWDRFLLFSQPADDWFTFFLNYTEACDCLTHAEAHHEQ